MPKSRYLLIIMIGLCVAQILSTIGVYRSNAALYDKLVLIKSTGYLTIPNQTVMNTLHDFCPAFFGGLFFTLTAGAGLTLLTLVAAWMWDRFFQRNKIFLGLFLLFWAGALVIMNRQGCSDITTSYCILVPAVVFWTSMNGLPSRTEKKPWPNKIIPIVPAVLLAFFWISQWNGDLFISFRDHFLLSNSFGTKINDGYYRYTLYAAEAFNSLEQQILKTCAFENIPQKSLAGALKKALIRNDYLPVGDDRNVDLKIAGKGDLLVFQDGEKPLLQVLLKDFFSDPGRWLKAFSQKCDRQALFRRFTFFSLLIALPIMFYMALYSLFYFLSSLFTKGTLSSVIASVLCLSIGIALVLPLYQNRSETIRMNNLAEALESDRWQDRIAALKIAGRKGIELADFSCCQNLIQSPHITERYWLARALSCGQNPETGKNLLTLLNDPHPNVVCMAFYALGQRRDRRHVTEIINRMETSDHWYEQWYAYKALRTLGWKQKLN